ncbi:MAG: hypothetical protein AUJ96_19630 [Armatimonadetes bacterium CG2_30_66_41]|nr:DctP family TRAP transporter solute-binding subunit [Armatimonadota bacterium]OIO99376.1 MAG: hypothetical protein AUJ96_19630 [Armatimonadetes bacterium CG2_30_66_41]NCO92270.1 DctP family TRAP transporter solute-binding subunit [Armatimonadota bacterium]NCP32593.1 DctP family TRAP transporter solute-binding subunit [Armatimonadota bacterium]NCQ26908.1 DctP family TRAP transporter solute-binding subunit [Armatimonadota bacterium]
MKRACLLVLPALLLPVSGCGKKQTGEIRLSLILREGSDWYRGAERWKQLVEDRSKGTLRVSLYPGAQLANSNQRTELEMVQSGVIEASLESTILLTLLDQEFSVFSLPWLFREHSVANAVCDGKLGQELLDLLPPKKLVGLAYGANGFRQVTNSRRPVRTPADLKALKIRVPAIKMYVSLFKLLGADPSSMNFGELFTALKEGTMDGQENPLAVIQQSKLYEVQKYVTRWDYSYDPLVLCMNKKRWESFSPEQQELLKTAAVEAMDYERKLVEAGRDALEKKLQSEGMTVTRLTPEQLKPFEAQVAPLYEEYANVIGKDLIDRFRAAAKAAEAADGD